LSTKREAGRKRKLSMWVQMMWMYLRYISRKIV
jgi:hypothetical protein